MKKKKRMPRTQRKFRRKHFLNRKILNKRPLFHSLLFEEDGESSFTLCDECAKFGYCLASARRTAAGKEEQYEQQDLLNKYNNGKSFADFVPTIVSPAGRGAFSYEHMRKGCNAFHEDDFETAFLHFKTITAEVNSDAEAQLCVAVCLFFMQQYLEAVDALSRCAHFGFENPPAKTFFIAFENIAVSRANEISADTGESSEARGWGMPVSRISDAVEGALRQIVNEEFEDIAKAEENPAPGIMQ